jgi:O-antigen/teichoic acid export membrane protein
VQLKAFIKDLAFVQVVNFLVKPLWILAVDRVVQNQLGQELYGQYYAAFNLAVMLIILTDLGLNNYLTKDAVDESKSSMSIIRNSIKIKLVLSLIYFALILLIGWQKDIPLGLLAWVGTNLVLLSISQWLRVWFNVTKAFRKESLVAVTDRLVAILLWLGIFGAFTLENQELLHLLLGAQTIGFIVAIGIALFFIFKETAPLSSEQPTHLKQVLISCLPFTLLAFFMAAFTRIDVELMDYFIKAPVNYHKGVYAQGFVILNAGNMMAALFGTMLLPIFTKQIKSQETVVPIMKVSTLIIGASSLLVLLILQFWGSEIYQIYYKSGPKEHDFNYHLKTFCTVIFVYIPMALTYVFGTYLTALGRFKLLVILAVITFVLNVCLNIYLQPILNAYGAAIAALITQSFFCLACIFYSLLALRKK